MVRVKEKKPIVRIMELAKKHAKELVLEADSPAEAKVAAFLILNELIRNEVYTKLKTRRSLTKKDREAFQKKIDKLLKSDQDELVEELRYIG